MGKTFTKFSKKEYAFTLAEILITLGIIGIVAAMTIPTLISNYQKQQTVVKLKETYSQLAQAIKMSEYDNGELSGWDLNSANWFDKYLAKYLKGSEEDWKVTKSTPYKETSGKKETGLAIITNDSTSFVLLNGVQILTLKGASNDFKNRRGILIDINGAKTKPNKLGRDAFYFVISNEYGLIPVGKYKTPECTPPINGNPGRDYLKNTTCLRYACNKESRGLYCAALIITDGWTIAKDYPW